MNGSLYNILLWPWEKLELFKLRKLLLSKAKGKSLEIGAGTGLNFPHYPQNVDVIATDPDVNMLKRAERKSDGRKIKVEVADAQELPFKDNEFDTVVATLVFCTIPNPEEAIFEVYRVLKPGGRFLLLEHVRKNTPLAGNFLDALTPFWKRIAGGCHLNRDPSDKLAEVGFRAERTEVFWGGLGKIWHLQKPLISSDKEAAP